MRKMIGTAMNVTMERRQERENMKMSEPNSIVTFRQKTFMYRDSVFDIV
jgi:hypothetical protein